MANLRIGSIGSFCGKIEKMHINHNLKCISGILQSLRNSGVEILVFPEYSIYAESLKLLHEFSKASKCICVAASHSVKRNYLEIYEHINMSIDIESKLGHSCCPVILPTGETFAVYKKYASKWETNMKVEDNVQNSDDIAYNSYETYKFAVSICIDALKTNVAKDRAEFLVVPAATPNLGQFVNKFESYLSSEMPSIFCNSYLYGGSTIYCHAPKNQNINHAEGTSITILGKMSEAIVLADLNVIDHTVKVKTSIVHKNIDIIGVFPILYRENVSEIMLYDNIHEAIKSTSSNLPGLVKTFGTSPNDDILNKNRNYISLLIANATMPISDIEKLIKYVSINDYSLKQYQINWVDCLCEYINQQLLAGRMNFQDVSSVLDRLYSFRNAVNDGQFEKIFIPVFGEIKDEAIFQNRGTGITKFKEVFQNSEKTVFYISGLASIGKSALVERLKQIHSFNVIEIDIPKNSGFERLLLAFCDITNTPKQWDSLDLDEISSLTYKFANKISKFNKTIIHLRGMGSCFDYYNSKNTCHFLTCLSNALKLLSTHIRIFVEVRQQLPDKIQKDENSYILRLNPLQPEFIQKLIEVVANNITFYLRLPKVEMSIAKGCSGNPEIAIMVGTYYGNKINDINSTELTVGEVENFTSKYVDSILGDLGINEQQKLLLYEMSIFRLPVKISAVSMLPSYNSSDLNFLVERFLVDKQNDEYCVASLLRNNQKTDRINTHKIYLIAMDYYAKEFEQSGLSMDKAEYLYYASFEKGRLKKDELKYYSGEVLSASIELCFNENSLDIALYNLESIKPWKGNYWKYQIYLSYAYYMLDDYKGYTQAFDDACKLSYKPEVIYYMMIKMLLRARKLQEVESLINNCEEKHGESMQLSAFRISLDYSNNRTRDSAIRRASSFSLNVRCDVHTAKILMPMPTPFRSAGAFPVALGWNRPWLLTVSKSRVGGVSISR